MSRRTLWKSFDLGIKDEPLIKSLIEYRQRDNRIKLGTDDQLDDLRALRPTWHPNLISSKTNDGGHQAIIDLDWGFEVVPSSTPGHAHLFLNRRISKWRWHALMLGLYLGGAIEMGFYVWSVRRGGNFVRLSGVEKKRDGVEDNYPTFGWFRKLNG